MQVGPRIENSISSIKMIDSSKSQSSLDSNSYSSSSGTRNFSSANYKLERHKPIQVMNPKQAKKQAISAQSNSVLLISLLLLLTFQLPNLAGAQDSLASGSDPDSPSSSLELSRIDPSRASSGGPYLVIGGEGAVNIGNVGELPAVDALAVAETSELLLTPEEEKDDLNLLGQAFDYHSNMPVITKRELANAIKQASGSVKKLRESEELRSDSDADDQGSAGEIMSSLANSMFHKSINDNQILNQTNQALISEETTRLLARQYKLNRIQILRGLPLISLDQTNLGKFCPRSSKIFNCLPGKYRSLTGHCNNVQNPDWGSAQSALVRYAPARYFDHVSKPAKSSSKLLKQAALLPSARAISAAIYNGINEKDSKSSTMQHAHITTSSASSASSSSMTWLLLANTRIGTPSSVARLRRRPSTRSACPSSTSSTVSITSAPRRPSGPAATWATGTS